MNKKVIQVEPTEKMKNFIWSPSKLATYIGDVNWKNGCGVRTYMDYFCGPTYDVASHYFTFGTYVHEVLETYHNLDEKPPFEQILQWEKELWIASTYKKNITKKFGALFLEKLENNDFVSFTDIDREGRLTFSDIEMCYGHVNLLDELFHGTAKRWMLLGYPSAEEEKIYNKRAHEIFVNYYKREFVKPISLEMFFNIYFDDVRVRGLVDRIDKKGSKCSVIDYKTSKKTKQGRELNKDFQMICYHIAAREKFGAKDEDIDVGLFFLCPQKKVQDIYQPEPMVLNSVQLSKEDLEKAHNVIVEADRKLKSGLFHYVDNNGKWQCPYCDHYQVCGR